MLKIVQKCWTKWIIGINNNKYGAWTNQRLMVLTLPNLDMQYKRTRDCMNLWLKLLNSYIYIYKYVDFMILKLFLGQAEWICWNQRAPLQAMQEDIFN